MPPAPEPSHPTWHHLDASEVARRLDTDLACGLPATAVAERRVRFGTNTLREARRRHPLAMFAAQFTDLMIGILIVAAIVSGVVGEPQDTIAIVVIVVLNGVVAFVQEYRADRAMAALRQMTSPRARVVRDGRPALIDARDLVPGDLVELEAGNILPADLRLTEVSALEIDESMLTGESQAVAKEPAPLAGADLSIGDRRNLAFKGTIVTRGRARGVVVATGMQTELGRIAALLEGDSTKTPLQKRLARFGRHLAVIILVICALVFASGWLRGEPPLLMLLTAVSLAVAAIPEALPAVVTITLALGASRLVKQNALIRRLPAVETLGSVTTICSDKTGTLTLNQMAVDTMVVDGATRATLPSDAPSPWRELRRAMTLCSDATTGPGGALLGDPTETALLRATLDADDGTASLHEAWPRIGEMPFDAARKRMSTLHADNGEVLMLVKGAPEAILPLCDAWLTRSGAIALEPTATLADAEAMAARGLRVLAFALVRLPALPDILEPASLERGLTYIGLAGLLDPPRPEAAASVDACREAGIVPMMITGDHPATARAIAARLGLADADARVLTGDALAQLSPGALREAVRSTRVYARIDPVQKLAIVNALQANGEFVAMTGDGVNDAPALKAADIGIAMGRSGTDVAREAAHMTLLDDNFATIVKTVREGRRIFDNIRKFVKYTMTSNSGEIWTIAIAPLLGMPIPLLPIHILWMNLVTDGLPGLALVAEPAEPDVMRRPPRPPRQSLFAEGLWQHILWVGLLMAAVCLGLQAWALHVGSPRWQSMVFTVLTLSQLGNVLAIRSDRHSLFTLGLRSNPLLVGAVTLTFALQLALLYVPWFHDVFKTAPLTPGELALCLVLASIVFCGVEVEKVLIRRGLLRRDTPR